MNFLIKYSYYFLLFFCQSVQSQVDTIENQLKLFQLQQKFLTRNTQHDLVRNYAGDIEADLSVPEIIQHWGYPVEIHHAITKDGYILELHRIPSGKKEYNITSNKKKQVVFFQHGLLCTSSVWVMNLPNQSAAFIFADAGFDVWLGNVRGNSYSKKHINKKIYSSKYWDFSWDEMARYDLDAMIGYVSNVTQVKKINYIAHSQGTLLMFSKLSIDKNFRKKINKFFAVAPVGTITHIKGLFRYLGERMYDQLMIYSLIFGDQEFLPNTALSRFLTEVVCGLYSTNPLCENFLFLISGPDSMQINRTRLGLYLAHNPAGTSLRTILHYCQMVRHGRLQAYDFGPKKNIERYRMVFAPEYNISKIENVPIYIYYSDSDWLATSADIERFLIKKLKPWTVAGVYKVPDFNHNDFLWGLRAADKIYLPIIEEIKKENSNNEIKTNNQYKIFIEKNKINLNKKDKIDYIGFKTDSPKLKLTNNSDVVVST